MNSIPSILLLSVSLLLLSCSKSVDPFGDEFLRIATNNSTVILQNTSDLDIHYAIIESETATRVDLAPISEWPTVEAGSKLTIPYDDIMGYTESATEAIVMWGPGNGHGFRSITVKL